MSIAHVRLAAGSTAPVHTHPHEQVANLIEGELEFTVDGKMTVLTPGMAVVLPPMVPHAATARTDSYVIDVFHPTREDLRILAEKSHDG
jgi:quercetin dioxygenase-like cupin family protein